MLVLLLVIETGTAMLLRCGAMNDEIRMSNDEIMTNEQIWNNHCYVASSFELRHCQFVSTSLDV